VHTREAWLKAGPWEIRVAWFAAMLSVVLAAIALLPTSLTRLLAAALGVVATIALTPGYLRRATPATSVAVTVAAAVVSTTVLVRLSGVPWSSGASFSQSGGAERPMAWLLTSTSWCLASGLLASGRLVAQGGRRRGALGTWGYRVAIGLSAVSFLGFVVVGVFPVGASRAYALTHNWAAWAAMGAFWAGMLATPWLSGVSRSLKYFSAVGSVLVFGTWLPCGLRFLGFTKTSPISTLHMELVVFTLCFTWLGWLAHEWGQPASGATRVADSSDPGTV